MADWYLNKALTTFRNEVNARWPNRDKTSDGTIGDTAHKATSSDHNPDPDGSVDAWDMDVDGVDVWECIDAALKHESIQYVIYNRRITSRTWGLGVWHYYDGPSPHDHHVHFNTRPSHENSTKPWLPVKEEEPMTADEYLKILSDPKVAAKLAALSVTYPVYQDQSLLNQIREEDAQSDSIAAKVVSIEGKVDALAAKPAATVSVDKAQLVAALSDPSLLAALAKAVNDDASKRMAA